MRPTFLAAAAGLALAATAAQAAEPAPATLSAAASLAAALAPIPDAVMVWHLYGGPDGESHLQKIALPKVGGTPGRSVDTRLYVTDVELRDSLPGNFVDFHGVSTPRFLIILSGQMEIGLGDGSKHILKKGDFVLAADTTGRGHTSRTIGDEMVRTMTVRLPVTDPLKPKLDPCPPGVASDRCVQANLPPTPRAH